MNGLDEKVELSKTAQPRAGYTKKEGPLSYGWLPLGVGRGIKWTLWKTSVTFQRREKQGDNWLTTEELHVAPKVLKEMVWRIPSWLESIDKNDQRRKTK